ncbi:copper chaperone [Orenia metallireducens]|jgi:copper ion binding protein|uniref:Copper chaperone CopZ n=1 Tax=Orenia metallireducens TaxID=1413210 RepID=A0A285H881_9FIRM|nr:cation transporter [Orenia metallireducens]PRX28618.1 copper chaperone [Orenia metallireducens]SNY30821.1 copper chaperone [Orenia metallireducens]
MRTETFEVKGMSCQHCKAAVKSALENVKGVEEARVNLEMGKVEVKFNKDESKLDKLKDEVRAAGYEVS